MFVSPSTPARTARLQTDLVGPLFCACAFVRQRKAAGGDGRLIFIDSVAGHLPTPGSAPYGMAKVGVNSLVRSLSRKVAEDRMNVNAIAPGLIATPMTQKRLDDPEQRGKVHAEHPLAPPRPSGGDCRAGRIPGVRCSRLRHQPDLRHGCRADHELGRDLSRPGRFDGHAACLRVKPRGFASASYVNRPGDIC